jgi:hypothetical protein
VSIASDIWPEGLKAPGCMRSKEIECRIDAPVIPKDRKVSSNQTNSPLDDFRPKLPGKRLVFLHSHQYFSPAARPRQSGWLY